MSPDGDWNYTPVITLSLNFDVPATLRDKGDLSKAPIDHWLALEFWCLVLEALRAGGSDSAALLVSKPILALGNHFSQFLRWILDLWLHFPSLQT